MKKGTTAAAAQTATAAMAGAMPAPFFIIEITSDASARSDATPMSPRPAIPAIVIGTQHSPRPTKPKPPATTGSPIFIPDACPRRAGFR